MTDFSGYLRSISAAYEKWWEYYTLTDLETDRAPSSPFGFELMVETVTRPGRDGEEKRDQVPVLKGLHDYVARETHVLLVGRPGSGKSTALARVLLGEASSEARERIPVLVELRSWKTSVLDLIRDFFQRHGLDLTTDQVQKLLADNRLFLLVDGLNELPSDAARQDVETLRNYRRVPMIFTTRDLSLGGDFGIQRQLQMQPLTEPQMQSLIRAYVRPDQADAMWRQITDGLRKFAETPLLLWMLCELFKVGEMIPKNLGEVFQAFVQAYENKSIRQSEVAVLKGDVQPLSDRRLWSTALKHLAAVMMRGEKPVDFRTVISRDEATRELMVLFRASIELAVNCVADLEKYHLLQVRSGNDLEFHHQLFQEYYAAKWLLERLESLTGGELQQEYLNYLKWTEPVAMMLALADEEQAVQVVELALKVDLMLGARLAGEVKPQFQAQTVGFVEALEVPDWFKVELLGRTRSDVAVPRLFEALEKGDCNVIRNAASALEKHSCVNAIPALLNAINHPSLDFYTSYSVATSTGKLSSGDGIPILLKALEDLDIPIRLSVISSLGENSFDLLVELLPVFLTLLQDTDIGIRRNTAEILKNATEQGNDIRLKTIVPGLLQTVDDPDLEVCLAATQALGNLGSTDAIPGLLQALKSPDECVRGRAAMALGNLGSTDARPDLLQALKDSDALVRDRAANALDDISRRVVANSRVQTTLTQELIWKIANPFSIDGKLIEILEVNTLPEAVLHLLKALGDSEKSLRCDAAEVLGRIVATGVSPDLFRLVENGLLKLMADPCSSVRGSVATALSEIHSTKAVPSLLKLLEDSDSDVRGRAVEALATNAPNEIAPHLPYFLTLIPTESGEQAHHFILLVQAKCEFYNYEIWQDYLTAQKTNPDSQSHDRPPIIYHLPNATEVKIFEHVDNYHQNP